MMKSLVMRAARRTLLPLRSTTVTRLAAQAFGTSAWVHHGEPPQKKFTSAHVDADIPESDYYRGHLMADHLEYLDDVLEKTVELEESMQDLHDTHEKKTAVYNTIGWTDSSDIEAFFQDAAAKKAAMKRQIEELKAVIETAKRTFAVDAPDGMPDGFQKEEMQYIEHIIDEAALHEDGEAISRQRAADAANRRVLGVDAPDGHPDAMALEEMQEINHIIKEAALHEDGEAILQQRADDAENRKVLGVDAPDGLPDAADYEDLEQAKFIIKKAAQLKEVILQQRELDRQNRKVLAVDAPDGTPDSLNQEELLAIKYIFDKAANHKGRATIEHKHQMQDKESTTGGM